MSDRLLVLLGLPQWVWVLMVPFAMFMLTLAWLLVITRGRGLTSFSVKGFGISLQVRSATEPHEDRSLDIRSKDVIQNR